MFGAVRARAGRQHAARGALLALCTLCCTEPADVPAVPDLTSLGDEYDAPTGTLVDGAEVQAVLTRYPQLARLANAFRFTKSLVARADQGRSAAEERGGRGIQLRGTIDMTVDCPGDGSDGMDPGSFSVELAVSRNRILQSFWGHAARCRYQTDAGGTLLPFELDGDVALDVGNDIPLSGEWPASPMLISLVGTLSLTDLQLNVSGVSARVDDESFEYLQPTESGSVVLFVSSDGVGLRDADATWTCGADNTACVSIE
jgi:hypothetical protein